MGGNIFRQGKSNHNVLSSGSKSSKLKTHGRHNNTNKVKYIVNIHVSDKFDI